LDKPPVHPYQVSFFYHIKKKAKQYKRFYILQKLICIMDLKLEDEKAGSLL